MHVRVQVNGEARVNREVVATIVFMNPVNVTLRNCTMTLSGSGLLQEQFSHRCVCVCVCAPCHPQCSPTCGSWAGTGP